MTLMFVVGSVQVDVEVVEELVDVLVVQVTAVLAGAAPQDASPRRETSKTSTKRGFIVPLSSLSEIPTTFGSASNLTLKNA